MSKRVISEKEVIMLPHNATLKVEGDYVLTPSARDIIQSRNIKIESVVYEDKDSALKDREEVLEETITPHNSSRFIISVFGPEKPGVVAKISSFLASENLSIQDISQRIVGELFTLFMIVDLGDRTKEYAHIKEKLLKIGEEIGVKIYIQHEAIFEFMHRI